MIRSLRRPLRASSVALIALLGAVVATGPATADSSRVQTVRPGHGVSLDVGSKHVVGYFLAEANACQVTLMMSDRVGDDEVPTRSAARIRQTVVPHGVARVETAEGETLELSCQADATGLGILVKTTVAAVNPARE